MVPPNPSIVTLKSNYVMLETYLQNDWNQLRLEHILRAHICQYITNSLNKPWFHKLKKFKRKMITTICRMRGGHCLMDSHLFRLRIKHNPLCLCGEMQDLQLILISCNSHGPNIASFINQLHIHESVHRPISMHYIIFNLLSEHNARLISQVPNACSLDL